tara:strand:+ start:1327 stop:1896 length:570 start_codon:yes stop_codon:yes gene_type:complete
MPEKVTRQEKIISLAIEKARKAKEELSAKQRKNIEPTQVLEIDTDPEVEKIKRPKVQDASKITNQTQKKEGYGLAGESLKKQDKPKKMTSYKNTTKDVRSADSYLSPEKRKEKAKRTIEQDDEAYSKMLSNFELEFKKVLKKLRKFGVRKITHPDEAPSLKILEEMLEGMKINLERKRRNNTKLIQENR